MILATPSPHWILTSQSSSILVIGKCFLTLYGTYLHYLKKYLTSFLDLFSHQQIRMVEAGSLAAYQNNRPEKDQVMTQTVVFQGVYYSFFNYS
jgi:hypothetical protein